MRTTGEKRLQKKVTWCCAIVFALFAYLFFAVYQAPLMEIYYDEFATGKLEYNQYVVSIVLTSLLLLLALWLNRFAKFQREWTVLAYIPSFAIMAFVTDIDRSLYVGGDKLLKWVVVFGVAITVYCLSAFFLRRVLFEKLKDITTAANRIIWRNLLLFTLFFMATALLSGNDEVFRNEARAYLNYKNGDIEEALSVGRKSLNASQQLTAQRAFYLAKCNKMGDSIFNYPQYYRSDGLLPSTPRDGVLPPDTVYNMLGERRMKDESAIGYLERITSGDSVSRVAGDYYMCALLLDKRVADFIMVLPRYYDISKPQSLPRHYKEAVLLYSVLNDGYERNGYNISSYNFMDGDKHGENITDSIHKLYAGYKDVYDDFFATDSVGNDFRHILRLRDENSDSIRLSNYTRRHFGDTYWWYYHHSR